MKKLEFQAIDLLEENARPGVQPDKENRMERDFNENDTNLFLPEKIENVRIQNENQGKAFRKMVEVSSENENFKEAAELGCNEEAAKFLLEVLPKNCEDWSYEEKLQWICKKVNESRSALPNSLLNLMNGSLRNGDCGRSINARPDWLDLDKFKRGQKFAKDYMFGIFFAESLSLFQLFCFEDGLYPLVMTGKSSTPYTAFKRYLSTACRVRNWYTEDPWTEGTVAHKDIQTVRQMHKKVREKILACDNEDIEKAGKIANPYCPTRDMVFEDFQSTCVPPVTGQCPHLQIRKSGFRLKALNQGDMAATQFAFVGLSILYPKAFGLHSVSDEDLEAFCHVWRGIGYLLGMEDEYNFCRGTLEDVKQRSRDFIELWVKPTLRTVTPEWEHMMRCVNEGINYYYPLGSFEISLLYLTDLLNLRMPRLQSSLSYFQWIRYNIVKVTFYYLTRIQRVAQLINKGLNRALDRGVNFTPEHHKKLQQRSARTLLNFSTASEGK